MTLGANGHIGKILGVQHEQKSEKLIYDEDQLTASRASAAPSIQCAWTTNRVPNVSNTSIWTQGTASRD